MMTRFHRSYASHCKVVLFVSVRDMQIFIG